MVLLRGIRWLARLYWRLFKWGWGMPGIVAVPLVLLGMEIRRRRAEKRMSGGIIRRTLGGLLDAAYGFGLGAFMLGVQVGFLSELLAMIKTMRLRRRFGPVMELMKIPRPGRIPLITERGYTYIFLYHTYLWAFTWH